MSMRDEEGGRESEGDIEDKEVGRGEMESDTVSQRSKKRTVQSSQEEETNTEQSREGQ